MNIPLPTISPISQPFGQGGKPSPTFEDLETLRQSVAYTLQKLVTQINQNDFSRQAPSGAVDMGGQRITALGDPASAKDAVNRDYVDRKLGGVGGGGSLTINTTSIGGGGGGGGSTITVTDITLTPASTNTLNPTAPSTPAEGLVVFMQAKGTGAVVEWGVNVKWAPTEFDSTLDTWTVFNFVGRTDPDDSTLKWFYIGPQPVTGQT